MAEAAAAANAQIDVATACYGGCSALLQRDVDSACGFAADIHVISASQAPRGRWPSEAHAQASACDIRAGAWLSAAKGHAADSQSGRRLALLCPATPRRNP
jgi:hypothetical protein